ncbi:MAG: STM4011 family radical SAM protein [Chromatiales bacterium]|nr:STM4011 family radical SAM protein [Chromatiales bacterium]
MNIDITYRGPLASCNYTCDYCPFAKRHDDSAARDADKAALEKFVDWVDSRQGLDTIRLLITPWGEALIRKWYRSAITRLSHMPHVRKVVIQTNLSSPLNWLVDAAVDTVALWTTYHPTETGIEKFVEKTQLLDQIGIAHSVGIVGKGENRAAALELRRQLNPSTYLWVNAYNDDPRYYNADDVAFYKGIDPLFELNNQCYKSFDKVCRSGATAIAVDGSGNVKPCHFIHQTLGNLYEGELHDMLAPEFRCSNDTCDCYIGYIHLDELALNTIYGERILERIPHGPLG